MEFWFSDMSELLHFLHFPSLINLNKFFNKFFFLWITPLEISPQICLPKLTLQFILSLSRGPLSFPLPITLHISMGFHLILRDNPEDKAIIQEWKEELRLVKRELKVACNPHFGSIFRTHRDEDGISNRLKTSLFNFVGDTGSTLRFISSFRLREMRT